MQTNRDPSKRNLVTDFSAKLFENKNILLFEFFRAQFEASGDPVVKGVKFRNCHIEGPAVLLPLSGCTFEDCNFGMAHGDMRNLVLFPASPDKVTGAIAMVDCEFDAVDFFSIGFTGAKSFLDSMLDVETRL